MLKSLLFWIHVSESNKDRGEERWRGLLKSESAPTRLRGRVRTSLSLGVWLLLEDVVDQDLKEDEKNDDDVVTLLEEGAALHPARCTTPQHGDGPVNVLLRLLYGFNGTLKFAEVCSFFPQPIVMLAFVSFAAG